MNSTLRKSLIFITFISILLTLSACTRSDNEFKNINKYEVLFNDNRNNFENSVELIKREIKDYSLLDHLENDEYSSYSKLICFDKISIDNGVYDIIFDKNLIQFMIDSSLDDLNGYYYSVDGNAYDPIGYAIRDIKENEFFQYSDRILTKGKDFSVTETKQDWEIVNKEEFEELSPSPDWYYLYRIDEYWFYYQIIVQ